MALAFASATVIALHFGALYLGLGLALFVSGAGLTAPAMAALLGRSRNHAGPL